MEPFRTVTGRAIAFGLANVDTDVIIPSRFLKALTREGLAAGLFAALRADPDNLFDRPGNTGAPILIAGENFGCGSSREHAAWALIDAGIRVVIAPSFADIFAGNAARNGLLTVCLPRAEVDRLMELAGVGHPLTVDLETQTVTTPFQDRFAFPVDPFVRQCLLDGLDAIAMTERQRAAIAAHEARIARERPWVDGAARRA